MPRDSADGEPYPEELIGIFEAQEDELKARFKSGRQKHEHGGLKGEDAESIVREFLIDFLPRVYEFPNGEIIDKHANRSREVDIAICNRFHPFTYSKEGQGILFIEGVEGVVEVKSTLNRNHLRSGIENCRSVRQLDPSIPEGTMLYGRDAQFETTPYFIFGFNTPYEIGTLVDKIRELETELDITEHEQIDAILTLDAGLILNFKKSDALELRHDETGGEFFGYGINNYETDLLMFLLAMYDKLPQFIHMPNWLQSYLRPDFIIRG